MKMNTGLSRFRRGRTKGRVQAGKTRPKQLKTIVANNNDNFDYALAA